jgi:hypothetical protein
MPPRKWARVLQSGAHGLRRGAWYPVVNDSSPTFVIIDVSKKNIPVDRKSIQLADDKPTLWSVVDWPPGKPVPQRMTEQNLPRTYGVCPYCRSRSSGLGREVLELQCVECGAVAKVDWSNPC